MKILNLYCGISGNAKLWGDEHEVTAIDLNDDVLKVYAHNRPNDTVIKADAHQYLLDHHAEFDICWSSSPCQTHSQLQKATRHSIDRYPDMGLYQEIIFLQHFFKDEYGNEKPWVVENVVPYYTPLIPAQRVGRHLFWSNKIIRAKEVKTPKDFIFLGTVADTEKLKDWLGIYYPEGMGPIYMGGNHCPGQALRNAVHPRMGLEVLESLLDDSQQKLFG
jgi:DNA (cytosine-5)-methyltransferase 1